MGVSDRIERAARHLGPDPDEVGSQASRYTLLCLVLTVIFGGLMFLRPIPWAPLFVICLLWLVIWANRMWRDRSR